MQTVNLASIQLDRCPAHGVWFDANELTELLKHAKEFTTTGDHDDHRDGLLHRLARVFGG